VLGQLAKAFGGRRGMLEAAVPTAAFTVLFLTSHELKLSVLIAVGCAAVLLVVRLGQRTTTQFVLNSLFGIGIGALFAWRAARGGGDANDQALAYFLPGILYNLGYSVVMVLTILIRWPLIGFMVGSVTGDPTGWHRDRQVVKLCSRLTWVLVAPCLLRVAIQAPIWLSAKSGTLDADTAVAILGVAKIVLGWPLQLAALALMVWLLARNRTPVQGEPAAVLGDPDPAESDR